MVTEVENLGRAAGRKSRVRQRRIAARGFGPLVVLAQSTEKHPAVADRVL